jgi:hypothetical protein
MTPTVADPIPQCSGDFLLSFLFTCLREELPLVLQPDHYCEAGRKQKLRTRRGTFVIRTALSSVMGNQEKNDTPRSPMPLLIAPLGSFSSAP